MRFYFEWINQRLDYIALVLILAVLAVLPILPLSYLVTSFVIDDALYYPKIAANVTSGTGVSYDGFTQTNGVHPLWEILWIPLAGVAQQNSDLLLRLGFIMSAVVTGGAFTIWFLLFRRLGIHPYAITVSLLAMFFTRVDLWMSLMESALTFLLLAAVLYITIRGVQNNGPKFVISVVYGAAIAALFLARLDTVILAPVLMVATAYVWAGNWNLRARYLIVISITALVITTPYVIWNLMSFGHLVPVSGTAKMSKWSLDHIDDGLLVIPRAAIAKLPGPDLGWQILLIAFIVISMAGAIYRRSVWTRTVVKYRSLSVVLGAYVIAVVLRQLYLVAVLTDEIVPWYLVPETVLLMIAVALGVHAVIRRIREGFVIHASVVVGFVILTTAGFAYLISDASSARTANSVTYETALWAKENRPTDSRLAMYDSGIVSYISGRDTLSVNGLATDFETMEALSSGGVWEVFEQFKIGYLVQIMPLSAIDHLPGDAVLFRSEPFPVGHVYSGQIIYVMDIGTSGISAALSELGYP